MEDLPHIYAHCNNCGGDSYFDFERRRFDGEIEYSVYACWECGEEFEVEIDDDEQEQDQ